MSATLGVEPDQLKTMATTWRREAGEVSGLSWSTTSEAAGESSDVLAAVRGLADPARQAMDSIAARYGTLADLVDKFSADIQARDAETAAEIGKLGTR
ncbi:hypothetical protein [Nocardia sp. NPDC058666]|uniref:hypothetical protein n=1 Tax=Nocardia sp. NPDC058666 TaxID=3346587 RepID=UPI0036650F8A